ncbi:MAG: hypothetical protein NTY76_03145 [Candidatus Omnitrophica bacterium]|nr:hypothetical protein [Candidatus Omnitrophota bacterium]
MKNISWVAVVLILAVLFILEFRYTVVVHSPIVAKVDRLTGDVWIANSGMWLKVQHSVKDKAVPQAASSVQKPAKDASQEKSK